MSGTADGRPIPETLAALRVPIGSLKPHPRNPRRGVVAQLVDSLRYHGQYRPIVARTGTGEILAGNHTWLAARHLGWSEIAVTFVDVDDDEALRILVVDNRANDLAVYDDEALVELLGALPDLAGTLFTQEALAGLLAQIRPVPASEDGQGRLDHLKMVRCPQCGHEFEPAR